MGRSIYTAAIVLALALCCQGQTVQVCHNDRTGVGPVSCTFPGLNTHPNSIVVACTDVTGISAANTFTASDTSSNTYTTVVSLDGHIVGSNPLGVLRAMIASTTLSGITVTCTPVGGTGTNTATLIVAAEVANLGAKDNSSSILYSFSMGTAMCSPLTNTGAHDWNFCIATAFRAGQVYTAGSGYSIADQYIHATNLSAAIELGEFMSSGMYTPTILYSATDILEAISVSFHYGSGVTTTMPRKHGDIF